MKIPLIIMTIVAIAALIVTFVYVMRLNVAQRRLKSLERQLNDAKSRLSKAEAFGAENEQAKTSLTDSYDSLKKKYERVKRMAYTDAGTDLPNRQKLAESFETAKKKCPEGEEIGLAMFAFRGDKDAGPSLLGRNNAEMKQEILQRLHGALSEDDDEIAVLSDDAFAVLTRRIQHRTDYESKIDKLFKLLALPMMSNGVEVEPVVYGAVTVAPEDGDTMQLLDMNLGLAMTEAVKQAAEHGESWYSFYTKEMAQESIDKMSFQAAVTEAVRGGAVEYPFIPRKRLRGKGIEQLAVSPMLKTAVGVVGGEQLFSCLDNSGLTMVVYEAMLQRAGECLKRFSEMGTNDVSIAIPVSERVFCNREFIKTTYDTLQNLDADLRRVTFELPEQAIIRNLGKAKGKMQKLTAFGIHFALEADGIPAIPVKELQELPVSYWKPKNSDVPEPGNEAAEQALTIVAQVAHLFGVKLIGTGVNSSEQESIAKECGLDIAQGTLYGEAMGAELIGHMISAMRSES
ncbi:MAG: EAL domain-containing protein [Lachnospiraceae bacterium]|nr:EAL domain-containing protein [Lachnospiraceae bacterium]